MMDKDLFADLVTSLKRAGQIARGKSKASRTFKLSESRIRAIRERTELSQADFARRKPTGPAAAPRPRPAIGLGLPAAGNPTYTPDPSLTIANSCFPAN